MPEDNHETDQVFRSLEESLAACISDSVNKTEPDPNADFGSEIIKGQIALLNKIKGIKDIQQAINQADDAESMLVDILHILTDFPPEFLELAEKSAENAKRAVEKLEESRPYLKEEHEKKILQMVTEYRQLENYWREILDWPLMRIHQRAKKGRAVNNPEGSRRAQHIREMDRVIPEDGIDRRHRLIKDLLQLKDKDIKREQVKQVLHP